MDMGSLSCAQIWVSAVHTKGGKTITSAQELIRVWGAFQSFGGHFRHDFMEVQLTMNHHKIQDYAQLHFGVCLFWFFFAH